MASVLLVHAAALAVHESSSLAQGALLAAAETPPWWSSGLQRLGGLFVDDNHPVPAGQSCDYVVCSWSGVRFVSDAAGDEIDTQSNQSSSTITIIGTDDGETWYTIYGHFVDDSSRRLVVDFSPIGGPAARAGIADNGMIHWDDGGWWTRTLNAPPAAALAVTNATHAGVEGPFQDFKLASTPSNGSILAYNGAWTAPPPYPGGNLRIFSDRFGNAPSVTGSRITVVGTDTPGGELWWVLTGRWLDRPAGILSIDFAAKGGHVEPGASAASSASLRGVYDGAGSVRWDDGNLYSLLEFVIV